MLNKEIVPKLAGIQFYHAAFDIQPVSIKPDILTYGGTGSSCGRFLISPPDIRTVRNL